MATKRQQRTIGAIVQVSLGDGTHSYAITLPDADYAFFDCKCSTDLEVKEIISRPVLFRVAVYKSAVTKGRWQKVGKVPALPPELAQPMPKFIQDALCPDRFTIYLAGKTKPATLEECEGLERCAVWEAEHVEDRLRDHYAGVPNKWVRSLQINRSVAAIRAVLLRHWNPKNVDGVNGRNAYDGYIVGITSRLEASADVDALTNHLYALETVSMRLPGNRERCRRTAAKLLKIRSGS
jgi:hypothetical protein